MDVELDEGPTSSELRNILVFESSRFFGVEDDAPTDGELEPFGKDVAQFLCERLAARGVAVSGEPRLDETHWYFFVDLGNAEWCVFVDWVLLDQQGEFCWAIQFTRATRGILRDLFSRKVKWIELQPVCELIDRIARESPDLTNVRWISMKRFGELW